jgi:hypothetical protein
MEMKLDHWIKILILLIALVLRKQEGYVLFNHIFVSKYNLIFGKVNNYCKFSEKNTATYICRKRIMF